MSTAKRAAGIWVAMTVLGLGPGSALAQEFQPALQPVDHIFGDVDPLSRNLRVLNQGIGPDGQESFMHKVVGADGRERLLYVRQDMIAEFDRSEYRWFERRREKKPPILLQIIPPNTVFHVGLPRTAAPHDAGPGHPRMVDGRVDRQVSVSGAVRSHGVGPTIGEGLQADPQGAEADRAVRARQTQSVLRAIDRVLMPEAGAGVP